MPPIAPDEISRELTDLVSAANRRVAIRHALRARPSPEAREGLFVALKDESERLLLIEPRTARALAELLVDAAREASSPRHVAFGLLAEADARRFLGDNPGAYDRYDRAGVAFLALDDSVGWARSRIGWLVAAHVLGQGERALEIVPDAQAVLIAHAEWIRAGALAQNAGIVQYELGHFDRAVEHYRAAIGFFERGASAGPARQNAEIRIANAKTNTAMIVARQGAFRDAARLHDEARAIYVRHGVALSVVLSDRFVADLLADQGRYSAALARYGAALDALDLAGLDLDAAQVRFGSAECYLGLNRPADALDAADRALGQLSQDGATTEAARAHYYRALALARLGRLPVALAELNDAAASFERAGLSVDVAVARLQRARLFLDLEEWSEADREASAAEPRFQERGMLVRAAEARTVRAEAAWQLEEHESARAHARAALEIAERLGVASFDHVALLILARVARRRGDNATALASCEAAMARIDRAQGVLATELRTEFLADKLPVYEEAIDLALSLGKTRRAFTYLERAKSRALIDYLVAHPDIRPRDPGPASRSLLDQLEAARREHHAMDRRLHGGALAPRGRPAGAVLSTNPAAAQRLREALREREQHIAFLLERLALERPDGVERPIPPPNEVLDVPSVDDATALVEYYLRSDRGTAFVVTAAGVEAVPLTVRLTDVTRLLNRWHLNLDAAASAISSGASLAALDANARGILAALHRVLLAPLERHLAGTSRLIVVPYGILHGVPFQALHDGSQFLLQQREVTVSPSSSLLRLVRGRARVGSPSALVLGHTNAGQLPGAVAEARTIAKLLPGECLLEEDATRRGFLHAAERHSILHLACHGEARLDNPTFAHLQLADGQLGASDVFGLALDGALVTLSACETGRAVVTGGDELIGLSRGFLFAGASTLVQSLWRVDDASTSRLMESFYRALLSGESKGAALRAAQLAALDTYPEHPCRWAAFQLVGDYGAPWQPNAGRVRPSIRPDKGVSDDPQNELPHA